MPTEKATIYAALCKAQPHFKPAIKDTANPFFKSKYADLASIWDACKDALAANELFVSQSTDINEYGTLLITRVTHSSGEYIESKTPIICAKDRDPQAFGSAMTYTRRYSLAAILGIITDDDDGEGAMVMQQPQKQQQPVKQAETPTSANGVTSPQKEEIISLLNNPVIIKTEREKMLAGLGKLTQDQAGKAIQNLKDTIKHREAINAELNEQQ